MEQETIANAIMTLTAHIREYAHITAWDIYHLPTDVEIEARKSSIELICKKIDALGQREDARFPDFKSLRHKPPYFLRSMGRRCPSFAGSERC